MTERDPRLAAGRPTVPMRLDWNESPLGPSPEAVDRVRAHAHELHLYPRFLLPAVTEVAARDHGVPPERLLLTNGVDEAIDLLLADSTESWSVSPGFYGYTDRAAALGMTIRPIPLGDDWQPTLSPGDLAGARTVFLDQPHNPTGRYFDPAWVTDVVRGAGLLCLDATYSDFADPRPAEAGDLLWDRAAPPGVDRDVLRDAMADSRLAVFHSFSKSHGLAGLRVGALIGSSELISRLRARQRAYTVDTVALHALAGSLDDPGHQDALRHHIVRSRREYVEALDESPLLPEVRSSQANFVLARGAGGPVATTALASRLGERGVWVKDLAELGLPGWLRVTVGDDEALADLVGALRAESPPIPVTTGRAAAEKEDS